MEGANIGTLRVCGVLESGDVDFARHGATVQPKKRLLVTVCVEWEAMHAVSVLDGTPCTKKLLQAFIASVMSSGSLDKQREALEAMKAVARSPRVSTSMSALGVAAKKQPYITLHVPLEGFLEVTWIGIPHPTLCARELRVRSLRRLALLALLQYAACMSRSLAQLGRPFPVLATKILGIEALEHPTTSLNRDPRTFTLSAWVVLVQCPQLKVLEYPPCRMLLAFMHSMESLNRGEDGTVLGSSGMDTVVAKPCTISISYLSPVLAWDFDGHRVSKESLTQFQDMGMVVCRDEVTGAATMTTPPMFNDIPAACFAMVCTAENMQGARMLAQAVEGLDSVKLRYRVLGSGTVCW
jgi:hypothetical protein